MKGCPENAGQNETAGHDEDKSCVLEERAKGKTKETPHFHNFYPQLVMCLQLRNVQKCCQKFTGQIDSKVLKD